MSTYGLGDNRWMVIEGDSINMLRNLEPVDHVITDPPYEEEAHTKQRRVRRRDGTKGVEVAAVSFAKLTSYERIMTAAHAARLARRWSLFFCQIEAARLWQKVGERVGLVHKRVGIWIKPDGQPQLSGDRPGQSYEAIEIMHAKGRSRWNGGGHRGIFIHNTKTRPENASGRRGKRGAQDEHETTKPLSLMLELISLFTDPDDIILDPFCGSGNIGVAALRLGRRYIGIDRKGQYVDLAAEQLRAEERGISLLAARAGQLPLPCVTTKVVGS